MSHDPIFDVPEPSTMTANPLAEARAAEAKAEATLETATKRQSAARESYAQAVAARVALDSPIGGEEGQPASRDAMRRQAANCAVVARAAGITPAVGRQPKPRRPRPLLFRLPGA